MVVIGQLVGLLQGRWEGGGKTVPFSKENLEQEEEHHDAFTTLNEQLHQHMTIELDEALQHSTSTIHDSKKATSVTLSFLISAGKKCDVYQISCSFF